MAAVRARMPDYFNTIPTSPMEIKRVPPAIEVGAPRGYAMGPSLDGSRPGAFYINLVDTRIWPKWALPTLTYHESIPGHFWQGSIVLENQAIPCSTAISASPLMARAGVFMPSSSPTKRACMTISRSAGSA